SDNTGRAGRLSELAPATGSSRRGKERGVQPQYALRFNIYPDAIAGLAIRFDVQFGGAVIDNIGDFDLDQIHADVTGSENGPRHLHRSAIEECADRPCD